MNLRNLFGGQTETEPKQKQPAFYEVALNAISSGVMVADKNRNIIYANDAVYKLLKSYEDEIRTVLPHFSAENLVGQNIDQFHKNPAHQAKMLAELTRPMSSSIIVGDVNFNLQLMPLLDENGRPDGAMVEWVDKTEYNMTANMLAALDRSQGVIEFRPDGEIVKANENFLSLMGYTAAEIAGKHHRIFVDPDYARSSEYRDFWTKLQRGEHASGEFLRFNSRGEKVWIQASYNPVTTSNGTVTRVVKYATDITNRKLAINDICEIMLLLSKGDLTSSLDREYEGEFITLAESVNDFVSNLTGIINEIRSGSETINNASSEIAKGNADLSSRTEQQASSLEETASSMEEITSTVQLNADNAKQANGLASEASKVAIDGGRLIEQVVGTMAEINDSAKKIEDIIGVIDGIAFQTNILALNAAVEAARAGEQGRGFAVVASEVRTLAQRSANAAKDIKGLISDSVSKVESGNQLVTKSGDTMQEIVTAIQRVNDIMSEIASASAEQASGIDEVNKAISQMDEMTQQNAALVEEAAAAAESMSSQASQLISRVNFFELGIEHEAASSKPAAPALRASKSKPAPKNVSARTKQISPAKPDDDEWESF
ncbi:methyl-accepting chemotaxis protein [Alteromonas gilva]|uniref:Methyl-accepting chemotaxis protein n=1 Tax=Alteromonas gilva TaxID=2987522 RepID=A0ABT5KYY7_9ALTE|nr:methyl-accepting chemotaxis protein [Alteromonas gilva]MDC8829416.1 methyl-accepting chemotaxis protein [Alteromonas gilva]